MIKKSDEKKKISISTFIIIWGIVITVIVGITMAVTVSVFSGYALEGSIRHDMNKQIRSLKNHLKKTGVPRVDKSYTINYDGFSYAITDDTGEIVSGGLPDDLGVDDFSDNFSTFFLKTHHNRYCLKKSHIHRRTLQKDEEPSEASYDGDEKRSYYVLGVIDTSEADTAYSSIVQNMYFAVIAVLLILFIPYVIIGSSLSKIFYRMRKEADQIGSISEYRSVGGYKSRFSEIAALGATYDRLLGQADEIIERQKSFNSDVSHELRTPIAVLKAQCQTARERYGDDPDIALILDVMERQTNRMNTLVQQLLNLSHIEQGKYPLADEDVDLAEIIRSICDDEEELSGRNDIFVYDIEDIAIIASNTLMIIALRNIISNAVRYSPDDKQVKISMHRREDGIYISIKDEGIGISDEDKGRIFETFYRSETSRSSDGFGLGLTLADRIVRLYKGRIDVESVMGRGSEFIVYLPDHV